MSVYVRAKIFLVLIELLGAGFLFGSGYIVYRQRTGEHATATVTDCVHHTRSGDVCTGDWWSGGSFHSGTIEDADAGDLDHKIEVVSWGDRAVKPGPRLPIILFCSGLGFILLGWFWWVKEAPRNRAA